MIQTDFDTFLNKKLYLTGIARDAKCNGILEISSEPIYIENLDSWSDDLLDKEVVVSGFLTKKKYILSLTIDEFGGISQGAEEEQYVFEKAEWKLK